MRPTNNPAERPEIFGSRKIRRGCARPNGEAKKKGRRLIRNRINPLTLCPTGVSITSPLPIDPQRELNDPRIVDLHTQVLQASSRVRSFIVRVIEGIKEVS